METYQFEFNCKSKVGLMGTLLTNITHLMTTPLTHITGDRFYERFAQAVERMGDIKSGTASFTFDSVELKIKINNDNFKVKWWEMESILNSQVYKANITLSFETIMKQLNDGDIKISKKFRWDEDEIKDMAVSLIKNLPIPPIYCYKDDRHNLIVFDGNQRQWKNW